MGVTNTSNSKGYSTLSNYIIIFSCYSFFLCTAKSEVIQVGGDNRWTDGFNYVSWADQFNFTVGDVLVFGYTKGRHNVYDVSKAAFQSCNPSDGVNNMYNSGNDRVELKEAKQYWFICTVDSHCSLGMKFGINVSAPDMNITNTHNSSNFASTKSLGSSVIYLLTAGIFLSTLFVNS